MGEVPTSTAEDSGSHAQDDHVKEVIRQTEQQLQQLKTEREEITKRIRTVKQTIAGLSYIFHNGITNPPR
jgi:prefoldin subunit 5